MALRIPLGGFLGGAVGGKVEMELEPEVCFSLLAGMLRLLVLPLRGVVDVFEADDGGGSIEVSIGGCWRGLVAGQG